MRFVDTILYSGIVILLITACGLAQPDGYYDAADGLLGEELRAELHDIIDNHTVISYSAIWDAFFTTDVKSNGMIWDMYSDTPGVTPPYEYTPGDDQGGSAGGEGEGYNREHSWPRSWFGGEILPMNTDINMIYPSDIYVNNRRGNYPYGEVSNPTWTSENGCKIGPCVYPGYTGTVFEPIDEYKGDFARAYFYMTVRYYGEDGAWPGSEMCDGAVLEDWAEEMLLEWHAADPVSEKEIERNNAVYAIQGNRNPFIDNDSVAIRIYRPEQAVRVGNTMPVEFDLSAYPNPFNPTTTVAYTLEQAGVVNVVVFDALGRQVVVLANASQSAGSHRIQFDGANLATGIYFLRFQAAEISAMQQLILVK